MNAKLKEQVVDTGLIRRNRMLFNNYNRLRRQYAYEVNPEKAAVAFEIIPALLSINEPHLPGHVPDGSRWCGISSMSSSQDIKRVIHEYFPETRIRSIPFQSYLVSRPVIESLFLIGSVGTVAQTSRSDFDYWVCVERSQISDEGMEKLTEKTLRIAEWCQDKFDMETHFFVSDLEEIRRNDFGRADEESVGSSQKKFLKEECYRTMLLVSGKIPFWWMLPAGIHEQEYLRSWEGVAEKEPYELDEFVDLGFLDEVSRDEFLGTALWQLTKGIRDPFKAILKMAMMVRYLSDSFQGPLLCDAVKTRVQGGVKSLKDLDPYVLMVETVLDFFSKQGLRDQTELLRKAFYIKSDPKITRTGWGRRTDLKVEIFRDLMERWGWSLDLTEDLNQLENWSYARLQSLSMEISSFFFSTYRRLSDSLRIKEKQAIDAQDLTVLGRKIYSLFSRQPNKLPLSPFLTSRRLTLDRCLFQYERDAGGRTRWVLYDATRYGHEKSWNRTQIYVADRVVRAAAWLVFNGLYDQYGTVVEMPSNPSGLGLIDLIELLKHVQGFFPPGSEHPESGDDLKHDARRTRIMFVVNMEDGLTGSDPASMDILYRNSWGEMFVEAFSFRDGVPAAKAYMANMKAGDADELTGAVRVHVRRSSQEGEEKRRVFQALLGTPPG